MLGAVSLEVLAAQHELECLNRELRRKVRDMERTRAALAPKPPGPPAKSASVGDESNPVQPSQTESNQINSDEPIESGAGGPPVT